MRSILAIACLATLGGCAVIITPETGDMHVATPFGDSVRGDGHLSSEQRSVVALTALEVSGPLHVDVRVGGAPSMQVDADANLLPYIHTEARGNTMRIWVEGSVNSANDLHVSYTLPQLTRIQANGSGRLVVSDLNGAPLNVVKSGSNTMHLSGRVASLDMQLSGSGNVNATTLQTGNANVNLTGSGRLSLGQVHGDALTANVHGSGELQASGTVQSVNAQVYGSGGANLLGLASLQADLSTYGSGDISASVKQALVAQSNGSGRITVYGNPAQRTISGKHVQVLN
ncbi:MAG: head GIN domain-containing protein [Pseudomonadota bacterium]